LPRFWRREPAPPKRPARRQCSPIRSSRNFAYWEFCSGFGVYDSKRNVCIEPLKDALLGVNGGDEKSRL